MMRTNACLLLPLGVLGLALSAPAHAADTAPPDVTRLAAAEAKIQAAVGSETVAQAVFVDLFAGMLVDTATNIAREQGIVDKLGVASPGFRARAERRVTAPVAAALLLAGQQRQDALYDALEASSTREAAHDLLAAWLAAPEVGDLAVQAVSAATKKEDDAFEAARKAADAERGDRPLTEKERTARLLEDAVRDARRDEALRAARNQERFRRQVVPEAGPVAFRVSLEGAALVSDHGNGGDDNGVVDAGEWISFTVPIENVTREPWFSSSAWVRASSPCVWTPASREVVLPELAPGAKGAVTIRAFLSESCVDQSRARFTVTIKDTHRTTEPSPVEVDVGLVVTNVGVPALRRYTMDVDIPGSSHPGTAGRLDQDTRAELSAGVQLGRAGARRALQAWGLSWPVNSIVVDHSFTLGEPMVEVASNAGSVFAPQDDLDVQVGMQIARGLPAGQGPTGGGVLALDTRVEYPGVEGAWAPPRSVAVGRVPPPPPPPMVPTADEVIGLVRKHLAIEARDTEPARGALVAVSTEAYDATVDKDAFKVDWCRATTPPAKPGEPDPCDPKAGRDAGVAPAGAQLRMPSFGTPVAEARPQKVQARAAWAPPSSSWTFGVNAGSVWVDEVTAAEPEFSPGETSAFEVLKGIGYSRGVRNRLRLGVSTGSDVLTVSGGFGRALASPRGGRFELEPHIDGGLAVMSASLVDIGSGDLVDAGETTAFVDVGADARVYLSRGWSLSSGLALRQQLTTISGPVLDAMVYTGSEEIRDASGLRFQFGVGYAFPTKGAASRASAPPATDNAVPSDIAAAVPPVVAEPVPAKDPSVVTLPVPAFEVPAAYTFRHYAWTDFDTWSSGARNALTLSLNLGPRSMLRVDQWDGAQDAFTLGTFDGGETLLGLGYARGLQDRVRARVFYGSSGTPYDSSALTIAAGYGRALPFARNVLELEPHADAGVALVNLANGGETTAFVDLGADARWFVLRAVSVHGGLAWR